MFDYNTGVGSYRRGEIACLIVRHPGDGPTEHVYGPTWDDFEKVLEQYGVRHYDYLGMVERAKRGDIHTVVFDVEQMLKSKAESETEPEESPTKLLMVYSEETDSIYVLDNSLFRNNYQLEFLTGAGMFSKKIVFEVEVSYT